MTAPLAHKWLNTLRIAVVSGGCSVIVVLFAIGVAAVAFFLIPILFIAEIMSPSERRP